MKCVLIFATLVAAAVASNYDQQRYQNQPQSANINGQHRPVVIPGRVTQRPVVLPGRVPGRQVNGGINQQPYGNQGINSGSGHNNGRGQQGQVVRPISGSSGFNGNNNNGFNGNQGSLAKPSYPAGQRPGQQQPYINQQRPAGGQNRPLNPPNSQPYGSQQFAGQQPRKTGYGGAGY